MGRESAVDEITNDNSKIENSLPECWTVQQYNNFKEKYDGLAISNKKLGCEYCAKIEYNFIKVKSVHVSKEWKCFQIEASGRNKEVRQASLRKKMKEHFSSKAHNLCKENLKKSEQYNVDEYEAMSITNKANKPETSAEKRSIESDYDDSACLSVRQRNQEVIRAKRRLSQQITVISKPELPIQVNNQTRATFKTANKRDDDDECELFTKMLAKKLRKLPENERELFMYEIDEMFISRYRSSDNYSSSSSELHSSIHKSKPQSTTPVVLSTEVNAPWQPSTSLSFNNEPEIIISEKVNSD